MRIGVLRVDLLSLRRDRSRALAQLGERAFFLWNTGSLGVLERDEEALRLRSLLEGIERCIADKESELHALRKEAEEGDAPRPRDRFRRRAAGATPEDPPVEESVRFTESGGPRPPRMEE